MKVCDFRQRLNIKDFTNVTRLDLFFFLLWCKQQTLAYLVNYLTNNQSETSKTSSISLLCGVSDYVLKKLLLQLVHPQ